MELGAVAVEALWLGAEVAGASFEFGVGVGVGVGVGACCGFEAGADEELECGVETTGTAPTDF